MNYLFYIGVYVNPNLIYHVPSCFSFGNHKFYFEVYFYFVNKFICIIFIRFHIQGISYDISLSLSDFTQYDNLQVHPCCCKWHYFFPLLWLIFHCIYVPLIIIVVVSIFLVTHQWIKYLIINLSGVYKQLKFLLLSLKTQPWELCRDTSASLLVNTSHWASPDAKGAKVDCTY